MTLRDLQTMTYQPMGLSDAKSMELGFQGCMASLSNLIPDPGQKGQWKCRPAAKQLTAFAGFTNPAAVSVFQVFGDYIYGLIASTLNTGCDEPFVYKISTNTFFTVSNINSQNVPFTLPSTGAWTPPTCDLVGSKIIFTHPLFQTVHGCYIGYIDISDQANPAWWAGDLTGVIQFGSTTKTPPITVNQFFGRAYYGTANYLVFSDTTDPINCTAGTQIITIGVAQNITAVAGLPLSSLTTGGVFQALIVFIGTNYAWQVTGDAALSTLAINQLNVATGTYSQNAVCTTPNGLAFMSPEGLRFVNFQAQITPPVGADGEGVVTPFYLASVPSRISMAYANDTIRIAVQTAALTSSSSVEYWYHMSKQVWSGPHTTPTALIRGYGSAFYHSLQGVNGKLYQSYATPYFTNTFVENGESLTWTYQTPLLPPVSTLDVVQLIELLFCIGQASANSYNVAIYDEGNNLLNSLILHGDPKGGTLWGGFKWGAAVWGSSALAYASTACDFDAPVVFKQCSVKITGASTQALAVGQLVAAVQHAQYKKPYQPVALAASVGAPLASPVKVYPGGFGHAPLTLLPGYNNGQVTLSGSTLTQIMGSVQGVCMIPASTEWGYAPYEVLQDINHASFGHLRTTNAYSQYAFPNTSIITGGGSEVVVGEGPDNVFVSHADATSTGRIGGPKCDWKLSMDELAYSMPNCRRVNLFASWFGNDLRARYCDVYPAVTSHYQFADEYEYPHVWTVAGITRAAATVVTNDAGGALYGGTPDDQSLKDAIADLNARGFKITFTPFLSMDVPNGNTLPDPYTGTIGQPVNPWRGRITKQYATADKTSQVATEVAAFVSKYNSFVLHYASLCAASTGGVDTFVIGSELRGLTWLRDAAGSFPFVTALVALAASVKAILPAAKITYAADWTELVAYAPQDGSNDLYFHLDLLWADANIDAVSFDMYWPLSDWRDGGLPNVDGGTTPGGVLKTIYDPAYLMSNVKGGEGYDWYYASAADRTAQTRTAITDGSGKPWVYRYKDIWSWWANAHYNRPGGVESGTPTAWTAQSKPIWLNEVGFPSIDKGTNEPNVFYDPTSSESAIPYFSNGSMDITIQAMGVNAVLRFFNPLDAAFVSANNPISTVYNGRMLDLTHVTVYTWDARPYPYFPAYGGVWGDVDNWPYGHWINGKWGST